MSRSHERAYELLAERVKLGAAARGALYVVIAALIASGLWWLGIHYFAALATSPRSELERIGREALALRVHGAAAMAALLALGSIGAAHARQGWMLKRNRASGSMMIGAFALLILTGYALYYLVDDLTRPPVSVAHWLIGLVLAPLLIVHIALGRRGRAW